jgi:branched-chain amino acid transport system permease protein
VLVKKAAWHPLLALGAAPLACAAAAAFVALFCVRLTGIYLGMLSFSFQMLLYTVIFKWYSLTGGDDGLSGLSMEGVMGTPTALYYLSLVLVAGSLVFLWVLVRAPFGKGLQAAKSNPQKSAAIGINVAFHRGIAFVVAGFFAGLAGALFALANGSVFPGWLNWTASAVPIVMTVLGGMHSFIGPVLGSAVYVVLQTVLTGYTEYWALILGVLVIAIVMLMPEGIMGYFRHE